MRILTTTAARQALFDCGTWSVLGLSATWEDVRRGGFTHDSYRVAFSGDFNIAANALIAYRIFPSQRMYARVCTRDGCVSVGATIIQRILVGPIAMETAVRVITLERDDARTSFAYATLQGHAERGIASFALWVASSTLVLEIETWSRSGHWLTWLSRPVARGLQRAFTKEALRSFSRTCAEAG